MHSATLQRALSDCVPLLVALCREAGSVILSHYQTMCPSTVQRKHDRSPVTAADLEADALIVATLRHLMPDVPVVSEEAGLQRNLRHAKASRFWLVDPLDGTMDFIQATGEFTINIAFIDESQAIMGIIYWPVRDRFYIGTLWDGAIRLDGEGEVALNCRSLSANVVAAVSARRPRPALEYLDGLPELAEREVLTKTAGSALKYCLLAEGRADVYPCVSPTSQWDSAAGQVIVEAAGGAVVDLQGAPLRYSATDDFLNPAFVAVADPSAWQLARGALVNP